MASPKFLLRSGTIYVSDILVPELKSCIRRIVSGSPAGDSNSLPYLISVFADPIVGRKLFNRGVRLGKEECFTRFRNVCRPKSVLLSELEKFRDNFRLEPKYDLSSTATCALEMKAKVSVLGGGAESVNLVEELMVFCSKALMVFINDLMGKGRFSQLHLVNRRFNVLETSSNIEGIPHPQATHFVTITFRGGKGVGPYLITLPRSSYQKSQEYAPFAIFLADHLAGAYNAGTGEHSLLGLEPSRPGCARRVIEPKLQGSHKSPLWSAYAKGYEVDINRIIDGRDDRTTILIQNIPKEYTAEMLQAAIDERHRGTYDYCYLPVDSMNQNTGFAFVNMLEPMKIVSFYEDFHGHRWVLSNSVEIASISYACMQGKYVLSEHFEYRSFVNEEPFSSHKTESDTGRT